MGPRVGRAHPRLFLGHILVVEDDEMARESVSLLLEHDGYEVSTAGNGHEALAWLYQKNRPDLIVLDLRMPVMDGWEFRAIQTQDAELREVPVVAISADGSAQAMAISAQAYLQRPFEPQALLEAVSKVLREQDAELLARRQAATELRAAWAEYTSALGHQLNNPLFAVLLNLEEAIGRLRPSLQLLESEPSGESDAARLERLRTVLQHVAARLEDCKTGADRIHDTLSSLKGEGTMPALLRPLRGPR